MRVLAADVGGTKTLLVVFDVKGDTLRACSAKRFKTGDYDRFVARIRSTCKAWRSPIAGACFAVAGPVVDERFAGTNLGWSVDIDRFKEDTGIAQMVLMNDFRAVGLGIGLLKARDLRILQKGVRRRQEPIAVIGAGTGLGEGYLTWEHDRYTVHPSEGGHCDFAPRDRRQAALLQYLGKIHGHVSFERVVSGPGLVNIYHFIIDHRIATESRTVAAEMKRRDPAAVISSHAQEEDDRACIEALELFVSIYGAEAGNLALKVLATGGVYVAGGIAPRIVRKLKDGTFIRAFRDKGYHRDLLAEIPVAVVLNKRVGLLGAARAAAEAFVPTESG